MKVLTLNTHSWLEEHPLEKLHQLCQQIIASDYDLIALQEVNQTIDQPLLTPDTYFHPVEKQFPLRTDNFAYLLIQALAKQGVYYHWSWAYNHIGYDLYHEGVALLSKTPIQPKALLVSTTNEPSDYRRRVVLVGKTQVNQQFVTALSCHYSWWENKLGFAYEWQQTETLLQQLETPFLLLGDFNNPASENETGYSLVTNSPLQLKDSFTSAKRISGEYTIEKVIDGWENNQQALRIDYVFVSPEWTISEHKIVFDGRETPVISDHFGIEVTVSL